MVFFKLPLNKTILLNFLGIGLLFSIGFFVNPAFAIPSPELVIGSVSSLTQIFAVGFAMVSGTAAAIGAKFGFKRKQGAAQSAFMVNAMIILMLLLSVSIGYIFYQNGEVTKKEQARLQQTLTRPAAFKGTKIQDESLKETSFTAQKSSKLSISTKKAAEMLSAFDTASNTILLDVREDAEFSMGTMPGARHIRFPDIATSGLDLKNKKVLLMCHNGNRSSETCERLAAMGIDCRYIAGGLEKWIVEGRTFTDSTVRGLSDLRAIPDYENKSTLISTSEFESIISNTDVQIIDTRYPKDFAINHLPNAINIPIRALPTSELNAALSNLQEKPTLVACYDRRSCFMGQVLGLEMSKRGIDYLGRYTTPWDYFVAAPLKPHIQEWLLGQNNTLWDKAIATLSGWLMWISDKTHFLIGVLAFSVISRLMILPISLKSERDQIAMAANKVALQDIKTRLKHDPARRARAVQSFQKQLGLTPLRNLTALLFLPLMMLGLSAIEKTAPQTEQSFLWLSSLGSAEPYYLFSITFSIFAGIYLHMTLASTVKRRILSWGLAVPLLFGMVFQLTAASVIYLNISLILLLLQRGYVAGMIGRIRNKFISFIRKLKLRHFYHGIIPLDYMEFLKACGNKSSRLAALKSAGFTVPQGVVVDHKTLQDYSGFSATEQSAFFDNIWQLVGQTRCVVRSSGSDEDGENQSFAGVFDSVLDVDRERLQGAFEQVLQSFQSGKANHYQKSDTAEHKGNILIQQMIDAEYSGVLFTQDPMSPGQMLLEMGQGTADDLVSGRITPFSLRYGKFTHQKCDEIDTPIDVVELLQIGQNIEQVFGCPQDIEWAYHGGEFFIVQSRDITTLSMGSQTELVRRKEWEKLFQDFGSSTEGLILKQDEMSEVLPRPTPLSFSIMSSLWAPGGSVDMACRELNLHYKMPEGDHGHLYQLFGKVYSDVGLKSKMTLRLPKKVARDLNKHCAFVEQSFYTNTLPDLRKKMEYWSAMDFSKVGLSNQLETIDLLKRYFVEDIYVVVEQINILANFLNMKAEKDYMSADADITQAMQDAMQHSPSSMIAKATGLPVSKRKDYLLKKMGHRAVFDYELSTPRYSETPDTLWKLAQPNLKSLPIDSSQQVKPLPADLPDSVKHSLRFQDLKEHAKHETLYILAILRAILLEVDHLFGRRGLVFYLTYEELMGCTKSNLETLKLSAEKRQDTHTTYKNIAPKKAALTLHDCEMLSNPAMQIVNKPGEIQGVRVAGDQDTFGTVYLAFEAEEIGQEELIGLKPGDILVCKMIHPSWLPYVLQSKAVICEVGGWLSHMAIVARENNITMLVGCTELDGLKNGDCVRISLSGTVDLCNEDQADIPLTAKAL